MKPAGVTAVTSGPGRKLPPQTRPSRRRVMRGTYGRAHWRADWPGQGAAPQRLARRLELGRRRRLVDLHQVGDAGGEAVDRVLADDGVQRHAALAAAGADLADDLPLQRLGVDPPLACDHGPRSEHAPVEAQRLEHERRAALELRVVGRPQPARQPARDAAARHAARVARQRPRQLVERALEPPHRCGVGALLRPVDLCGALPRCADVAEHDEASVAQPAVVLGDRLQGAGAAIDGRAATGGDDHHPGAGVDGGADQLSRAVCGSPLGIAFSGRDQPQPTRLRHLDDRRVAVLDQPEGRRHGPSQRIAHLGGPRLAAEHRQQHVQRPLAAVGDRAQIGRQQARGLQPSPDRRGDLRRAERALERVGRDEDRH